MEERTAPKQERNKRERLKDSEDYGARGLHGEAGTTKDESIQKEGGVKRDKEGRSGEASTGRPTTPGQSKEEKDKIAGRRR